MSNICPNLNDPEVKKQFQELIEALGEDLAYLMYARNNGNFLDKTSKGEDSKLFSDLLLKTGDRIKAIQYRAMSLSDKVSYTERLSKVKYNYNKSATSNKVEARNNALIDITTAVLTNTNTLKDFISPGGFDTLVELADRVKTKTEDKLNFFSIRTQNTLAERNMTGKSLVGVAANHNKNYAIRMWSKIGLTVPIMFDGYKLDMLNGEVTNKKGNTTKGSDIKGTPISKNLAEFLAAIVDNAKDPVAAFINYNTQTADIMSMIVSAGYPLETAVAFMNQPIIKNIVDDLLAAPIGGEYSVLKSYAEKAGISYTKKNLPQPVNITTEQLWNNINNPTKNLDNSLIASFIHYKEVSRDFAQMIKAMRGDTQGGAAGPTLSDNLKSLSTIEKAQKSKHLKGIADIVGETGPSRILSKFTERSLQAATDMLEQYFPNTKPAFQKVRKTIEKDIDRDLSVKEIQFINSSIITYMFSNNNFYKVENKERFVKELPIIIRELKENEDFNKNSFAQLIKYVNKDRVEIPFLSFDNTKNYTDEHRQTIITGFYDLLGSDNTATVKYKGERNGKITDVEKTVKFSDIARDLIRYSFFSSGFNFGPNSFFHLVPIEFYTEMEGQSLSEYTDNIMTLADNKDALEGFIDQFYRNNYNKSNYVPVVEKDEKGNPANYTEGKIDGDLTLKPKVYEEDMPKFILHKASSKSNVLYKYDPELQIYIETQKLGIPNVLVEYDQKDPSLNSIVNKKKKANPSIKSFKKDPTVKDRLFGDSRESNIVEVLGRITYSDHPLAPLANKLLEYAIDMRDKGIEVPINLLTGEDFTMLSKFLDIPESSGVYSQRSNTISINEEGFFNGSSDRVVLHEIIHSMTAYFLDSNSTLAQDFKSMYEYAKANSSNKELYGYEDIHEFAAEIFTNSELIRDLKSMNPTTTISKYSNLFEEIIDKILQLLGIREGETAYEQASAILSNVINYGRFELYNRSIQNARQIEIDNNLISPTGKRYFKSYKDATEIAKNLNTKVLSKEFEAKSIQFRRDNGTVVWGVKVNPKNISTEAAFVNEIMSESEVQLANYIITDKEAEEQKKICES